MKKNSLIILGITALAMAIAVPLAFAGGPGQKGGWGEGRGGGERGARIAEKLGLNEAQAAELKLLREDMQTDVSDIKEQIRVKRDAVKATWKTATPDRVKILAAHKEIAALELQIAELHVDFMFAVKGKLTPEQFQKFVDMRGHGGRGGPGWGGKGMRGGRGDGSGFGPRDGSGPRGGTGECPVAPGDAE